MARRLLLLTDDFGDEAMQLADALKARGYHASPYNYPAASAEPLVHETPVVLLLSESARRELDRPRDLETLALASPNVRFVNVLLPEGIAHAPSAATVRLADFSPSEIGQVVAAIEANLAVALAGEQPSIAIVWEPAVLEPEDYGELVAAIAAIARATGAAGIRRLQGIHVSRSADVEA